MQELTKPTSRGVARHSRIGAAERDWTKGSITRNLWSLSLPVMLTNSLNTVGPFVDMIWVGRLGAASIAGVGIAGMAVQLVSAMKMGLITGMRAMIARHVGAGDREGANHIAQQAFVISAAFSLVMAAVGIFLSKPILALFGLEADVVAQGATYLSIMFVGSAAMSFRTMTEGVMQASGDAVTPMRIAIFYRLFHVALTPFLIFGWWLFPRLEVSGAALSNVFTQAAGVTLSLWILFSGGTRLRLTLKNFRLDPGIIWRITKIGLPASVLQMERVFAQLVLMRLVTPFGTLAVAAKSLFRNIETMLLVMPGSSVGRAAGVLAAQNLGAAQPERAQRTGWLAASLIGAFMVISFVAMQLWAERVMGIFSSEPTVVEVASTWLRVASFGFLAAGFIHLFQNIISDVGDTMPPMLIALLGFWFVEVPMAFTLPRVTDLGVYGIQWATVMGQFVRGFAYLTYFKAGKWKNRSV